jgi:type II secretory pathway component PulK
MKTGFLPSSFFNRRRSGMVLLSVLLISVFLVSASTGFAVFVRRTLKRYDREQRAFTARMTSEVVMDAAKLILSLHTGKVHYSGDRYFASRSFSFPESGVTVTMKIDPLDDRIPLNKLFLPDGKTLRREMEVPWAEMWRLLKAEYLEATALDFLDKDTEPRLGGMEHPDYLNRPLLSMEELLLLPGMTPELLYGFGGNPGLRSMATIWSSGRINLNAAPLEVLSILEGLDEKLAVQLLRRREEKPLESIFDLATLPGFPVDAVPKLMNIAAFRSDWFRVSFDVLFEDGEIITLRGILNGMPFLWKTVRWEEP